MNGQAKGKVFKCLLNEETAVFRSYLEFVCLNMVNDFRNSEKIKLLNTGKRTRHYLITAKEMDVLSVILYNRYKLSFVISNEDILNNNVTNSIARRNLRVQLGITHARFSEILNHLSNASILIPVFKDSGRIEYYKIHEKFIPQVYRDENGKLSCMMRFILRSETNGEISS